MLRAILQAGAGAAILAAIPERALSQPDRNAELDEIVVTSSIIATPRRQIGTAVSVIERDEMELRGYESLADVLRTQPGVGVTNSGGLGKPTALRIRGEESFRTLLLIDGVKAVDPGAPQVAPSFESVLTTGDLQRVEVLRGPQGFMYGADAGGVVNVLTRAGTGSLNGRVGLELGAFDTQRVEASLAGGNEAGDYFVSLTDLATDGFNAQTADTVLMDDDGLDNTTVHAKLGWNPTDSLRVQLVARDVGATTRYDGCFSSFSFATIHDCVGATDQTTYKLSLDHDVGRFRSLIGFSRVDIAREDFADGARSFTTRGELARFEYTGSFEASARTTLVYGIDLQRESMAGPALRERDQNGYYVEYQGAFGDRLFVSAGARYDDNEDFGAHVSTRLSAAYLQWLSNSRFIKYRASFGTGFRPPSLYEIAYNGGPFAFPPASTVILDEESSRGYDIGVEYGTRNGLRLEVTYFDQDIEDEIYFDLLGFSGYLQSPGSSHSRGIEIAARAPLRGGWSLRANWTRNEARDTQNAQRLRRPDNIGNLGLLYSGFDDRLRFATNYRLAMTAVDVGLTPLDDYEVLDLSMAYSLGRRLEVFGRIENATDEQYQEVVGFNAAGRAAYAGVRLRL